MVSSLVLASALSLLPAQPAGGLQLTNVRLTVGELGPTRKDSRLLPGDILFIAYEINGITIEDDGVVKYTMAMEVNDAAGKAIFKQDPRELQDFVPLGARKLPARAFITIGLDQEPGEYSCKVTVADAKTKASNSLQVKFTVLKRDFGVVAVYTSHDERGSIVAPATGLVGQTVYLQFSVASFQRDPKTKLPTIEFLFEVLDDKGQATLKTPKKHIQDAKNTELADEKDAALGMRFPIFMSRAGNFTVRITATDKVANKKSTYELPVVVLPAN